MAKPSITLAEGAERFDRLARILKDNQLAKTRGKPAVTPPLSEVFVLSPDEAWAKQYMTQCIGPVCFTQAATPPGFAKFPAIPPQAPPRSSAVEARSERPATSGKPAARQPSEPIGRVIGKPVRPRSWLARLFTRG
jgi:hypothetical protein